MSILPLFLVVAAGVVYARHISYYDDDAALQPIMSRSQERRICTELCMSGLGGDPCGDDCQDLTPQGLPIQSASNLTQHINGSTDAPTGDTARRDVCPVLCENRLGYPLCNCDSNEKAISNFRVNFIKVCSMFCTVHQFRLYGCQECKLYTDIEETPENPGRPGPGNFRLSSLRKQIDYSKIDWEAWCKAKCHVGDGGAACNCDLLPMMI